MGTLLLARYLLKPLMYKILPPIFETFHPPTRKFLRHLSPNTRVDPREIMQPVPSIVRIPPGSKDKLPKYDIDIASKFIVYFGMGWATTGLVPDVLWILNLL